jgi:hypothetical protein
LPIANPAQRSPAIVSCQIRERIRSTSAPRYFRNHLVPGCNVSAN